MIQQEGQELCPLPFQAALDLRAHGEPGRETVSGHDNIERGRFRKGCKRATASVFGEVGYRKRV